MEDKEVIKALECCVKDDIIDSSNHEICFECPLKYDNDCSCNLRKSILDLINRQKAEIERLEEENRRMKKYYFTHDYHECHNEAIKEFSEEFEKRCIASGIYPVITKNILKNLVKEKTEGKE